MKNNFAFSRSFTLFVGSTIAIIFLSGGPDAGALSPQELGSIAFEQRIGQQIAPDLTFHDSAGADFQLGAHFNNKPMLLVLGYYHCPMLCALINNSLIAALQELRLNLGKDFEVINVSIDPRETPTLAAARKKEYLKAYGRSQAAAGWHFLTADEAAIGEITRATGFHFAYDPKSNEYAHPSGIIVLTPEGKISRYFLGVNFDAAELNRAITAARNEENGSIIQRLALICYHYNPVTGKYGTLIMSILRASAVATVAALIVFVAFMVGRDRRARRLIHSDVSMARRGPSRTGTVAPYQQ
jgi:protein SCO1/2